LKTCLISRSRKNRTSLPTRRQHPGRSPRDRQSRDVPTGARRSSAASSNVSSGPYLAAIAGSENAGAKVHGGNYGTRLVLHWCFVRPGDFAAASPTNLFNPIGCPTNGVHLTPTRAVGCFDKQSNVRNFAHEKSELVGVNDVGSIPFQQNAPPTRNTYLANDIPFA
jgi:hypothetical protein